MELEKKSVILDCEMESDEELFKRVKEYEEEI